MFKNISPDLVWSDRICPANLGVRSCPVGKLICPVRSSPTFVKPLNQSFRTCLYFGIPFSKYYSNGIILQMGQAPHSCGLWPWAELPWTANDRTNERTKMQNGVHIRVLQSTWQLISKSLFIIFWNIWMEFLANGTRNPCPLWDLQIPPAFRAELRWVANERTNASKCKMHRAEEEK